MATTSIPSLGYGLWRTLPSVSGLLIVGLLLGGCLHPPVEPDARGQVLRCGMDLGVTPPELAAPLPTVPADVTVVVLDYPRGVGTVWDIARRFVPGMLPPDVASGEVAVVADQDVPAWLVGAVVALLYERGIRTVWLVGRSAGSDICGGMKVPLRPPRDVPPAVTQRGESWGSALPRLTDGSSPVHWLTWRFRPLSCEDAREHAQLQGLAFDRQERRRLRARFAHAFEVVGSEARLSDGLIQTGEPSFWAGVVEHPPVFRLDDPARGWSVALTPLCAVYYLATTDLGQRAPFGRVYGTFLIEAATSQVTFAGQAPFHLKLEETPLDRSPTTVDDVLRLSRDALRPAMVDRVTALPPGPARLQALQDLRAIWGHEGMASIEERIEVQPDEALLVTYREPSTFAVADKTTIVGTLPLLVRLDGAPLPIEPLLASHPGTGQQLARTVIEGTGAGVLSLNAAGFDFERILFSWAPGGFADVSVAGLRTQVAGPRCVISALATRNDCGAWAAGEPAFPHADDCGRRRYGGVPPFGELDTEDGEWRALFILLRPGAHPLVWGDEPTIEESERSCDPSR